MTAPLHVVILAAGQGSRMKSRLPKVLHVIAGTPMVHHVMATARKLGAEGLHLVIGHGGDQVQSATSGDGIHWVWQREQLGTGHAVAQALPDLPEDARVLILYGDVPLISDKTLERLLAGLSDDSLALLTVSLSDPDGYGRIVRDGSGRVQSIVEQKDASAEQLNIAEVNTGIMAVQGRHLHQWLPKLSSNNAQGEYYLTDIIAMAVGQGLEIAVAQPQNPVEVQGVNNRIQLAQLERWYQGRQAEVLMTAGATLADPARVDIRGSVDVGQDVFIDINTVFEGQVRLGNCVRIGPGCVIRDAEIADDAVIHPHSIVEEATIGAQSAVGPFARIRPGTVLAARTKVGNFVETKKAIVGAGSKINHLSYVGDAELGEDVNVGAGTITCNYDGVNKHKTVIGDRVFVGSNTALVAPVVLADDVTIAAGSTITKDVDARELAVARGRQRNVEGWQRPTKNKPGQ